MYARSESARGTPAGGESVCAVRRARRNQGLDGRALGAELGPQIGLLGSRDQAAEVRVGRDRRESGRRSGGVERDIGAAELEDPVDPDERLEGLVEEEPYAIPVGDAALAQEVGQAVRARVEPRIGHAPLAVHDRRAVGVALRGRRQQVVDEPRAAHRPMLLAATLYWSSEVPE
jgi:hypothetical protein